MDVAPDLYQRIRECAKFIQGAAGDNEKHEQADDTLVALSGVAYGESDAAYAPVL